MQVYEKIETKYFEVEPTDLVAGIQLQHLCKVLFHTYVFLMKLILSLQFTVNVCYWKYQEKDHITVKGYGHSIYFF